MMILVDVHAHIDYGKFDNDRDRLIENAMKNGVKSIINNGLNPASNRKTLELCKKHAIVKAALGMYPLDGLKLSDDEFEAELEFIENNKSKVIAIGEIGLDYYWQKHTLEEQKKQFVKFLELAKRLNKPVIVHSRDAEEETIRILEQYGMKKVVMHCFGGNVELALRCEKNGWMLSIPCTVLRSSHFQKIVKAVNINNILTETDCPYLAPEPKQRNEPANVIFTVEKIAEIKGMDKEEVANNIFMNYQKMFL
jgi:TatD DNase family protein